MNKYNRLVKKITKTGIKCGVLLVVVCAVYAAASQFTSGAIEAKTSAEAALSQDEGLLSSLRSQIDKTGVAEKKFIELQGTRSIDDFSASFEKFQDFLKASKDRYRLSVEILPVKEVPSDKAELKNFAYDVMVRPKVELSLRAISDVHVFSFLSDLQKNAPGLVHIEKVSIKRADKTDMTPDTVTTIQTGASPMMVEASIQFTLIRFVEKPKTTPASPPAPQ